MSPLPAQSTDDAGAKSLSPKALYVEVAELLRQRIFKRELEPGSWIDELRLPRPTASAARRCARP
jgi:DNA-binding GntR family transcriptional regulator